MLDVYGEIYQTLLRINHFIFGKTFFVILDSRGGDLNALFRHEASTFPSDLSSGGLLHTCTKSDLLKCLMDSTASTFDDEPVSPRVYDFIVFDGGYLTHALSGKATNGETFDRYFDKVFLPRMGTGKVF